MDRYKALLAPRENLSHFNIVERFLSIVRSAKQEIKNQNRREREHARIG
jgi:hypothetical protein